jgi:class 3 adenylate cyclase
MALQDDLQKEIATIFKSSWNKRDGRVVPEPADLQLGNDAVEFGQATVLYADISGSTALVDAEDWTFAAEVYKAYLHCAAKLIRSEGGAITSYDGDRLMGIFVDEAQCTPAARCALKINYAVQKIVNPALKRQYSLAAYQVKQVVGIDTSSIRAARTGVRGGNDIVWVGRAANYAAKLTGLNLTERSWITKDVFDRLQSSLKVRASDNASMWKAYTWSQNNDHQIYGSTWTWSV